MNPVRTLIVVADGAHARYFLHEGPGKGLDPLPAEEMESDTPAGRDIMADRPGRSFSSVGQGRSAMEPKSDPRDLVEKDFARATASRLAGLMRKKDAKRLIIAAAPATLGELRKALDPQARKSLIATLDKDLTNTPDRDLAKHFEGVLAV